MKVKDNTKGKYFFTHPLDGIKERERESKQKRSKYGS